MKKPMIFMLALLITIVGLFAVNPASASGASSESEVVALAANTIYYEPVFYSGPIRDSIFVSTSRGGYQYRGYITFDYIGTGGAYYSGTLYRAPLPYPVY